MDESYGIMMLVFAGEIDELTLWMRDDAGEWRWPWSFCTVCLDQPQLGQVLANRQLTNEITLSIKDRHILIVVLSQGNEFLSRSCGGSRVGLLRDGPGSQVPGPRSRLLQLKGN